mmetsp:Transcript_13009/g.20642  ORF Transcript_13009/g.20642 Transcript_13009/m.20642 type:complete len:161 (+) Transcript_13009:822-1304(+)
MSYLYLNSNLRHVKRRHDESRRRGRRAKKRYSRRDSSRRPHGHRHRSRSRNRPRKPERYRSVPRNNDLKPEHYPPEPRNNDNRKVLKEFGGVSALGEGRLDERLIRSGENEGRKEKTKVLNQLARPIKSSAEGTLGAIASQTRARIRLDRAEISPWDLMN